MDTMGDALCLYTVAVELWFLLVSCWDMGGVKQSCQGIIANAFIVQLRSLMVSLL